MNQFTFNDKKSYDDYKLVLQSFKVGPPNPMTHYVEIPGAHGSLDLSEAISGEPIFENRAIDVSFILMPPRSEWIDKLTELRSDVHGRRIKIWEPDDDDHYFVGRMSVGGLEYDLSISTFSVTGSVDPFRYKKDVTKVEIESVTSTTTVNLKNSDMSVLPSITTNAPVEIFHNGNTFTIDEGTHRLAIVLVKGDNEIKVKGAATVIFEYQEGVL